MTFTGLWIGKIQVILNITESNILDDIDQINFLNKISNTTHKMNLPYYYYIEPSQIPNYRLLKFKPNCKTSIFDQN